LTHFFIVVVAVVVGVTSKKVFGVIIKTRNVTSKAQPVKTKCYLVIVISRSKVRWLTGKLTSTVKVCAILVILLWTGAFVNLQGEVTV